MLSAFSVCTHSQRVICENSAVFGMVYPGVIVTAVTGECVCLSEDGRCPGVSLALCCSLDGGGLWVLIFFTSTFNEGVYERGNKQDLPMVYQECLATVSK